MRTVRSLRDPEVFQWFGLLAAALAWTVEHVVGFGATVARCGSAFAARVDVHSWELGILLVAAAFAVLAEAAALTVFFETRGVADDGPPPQGRRHFFAAAAVLGNVLFLLAIVLSGISVFTATPCHQA